MSTQDQTMTLREWAAWMGWASAGMAYQAKKEGRLVLTEDGRKVLAEASKARYLATSDPAKRGVTERHAAERAAPVMDEPDDADGEQDQERPGYDYQSSKAKREHWAAEREHAAYRKEAGELIEVSEHVAAFASAGALVRATLESWVDVMPPQLAGRDETAIRATLADQMEQLLRDLAQKTGALAQETDT